MLTTEVYNIMFSLDNSRFNAERLLLSDLDGLSFINTFGAFK